MKTFSAYWFAQAFRRMTFDNRLFWNRRYIDDPEKGSGPGSRGEFLLLKNKLITSILEDYGITSILDIGCGDIAVLESIEVAHYMGIDISDVVVARNKNARPQWEFVCADLTAAHQPKPAELVICLDVLIHQKKFKNYVTILSKTLDAAKKIALISGYHAPYRGWNVFFHEPIDISVRRLCPTAKVDKIAEYQSSYLLKIEK
jgi:SAM-dependent methyltransferase